jgi:hypothetical protein
MMAIFAANIAANIQSEGDIGHIAVFRSFSIRSLAGRQGPLLTFTLSKSQAYY